jgi:subtilisin family serine protease
MPEVPRFQAAPVERRTEKAIREQRERVTTQINLWIEQIRQPATAHALRLAGFSVLERRRAGQPVTQFTEDRDALVVTDRVVIPVAELDAVHAQTGDAPARVLDVPGLDDIRILEGSTATRRRRSDGLEATGVPGAPIHLVPMGAIRKAEGGPEASGPEKGEAHWTHVAAPASGPRIAVVDTGITDESRADGWLSGLATGDNVDLLDVLPPAGLLDLGAGHGTFVTGVIQQVAPEADIEVVRVLDTDGLGDEIAIGQQLVEAARRGVQIVNLSLGTVTADDSPPLALETAVRAAIAAQPNILFVCAAGNYADERPCWPAAFAGTPEFREHVVSVAALALDPADGVGFVGAEWSSRGDTVTCSVPGQGVVSTYVEGTETEQRAPLHQDTFGANAWATWSGTSFAAPQITGAVALIMQGEDWNGTPMDAFRQLMKAGEGLLPGYGTSIAILPV